MSLIINKFEICTNISDTMKQTIVLFHVFWTQNRNIIFITNEDKVFGLGNNSDGCLALGHNKAIDSPHIIPELCHKKIQHFYMWE